MQHNDSTHPHSLSASLDKTIIDMTVNGLAMVSTSIVYLMTIKSVLNLPPFSTWLLKSLSIADFISSSILVCRHILMLTVDFGTDSCSKSTNCVITSAFVTTATLSSFAWNITIGIYCTTALIRERTISPRRHTFKKKVLLYIVCWGGAVALSVAALIRGAFGRTHTPMLRTCWIRTCDNELSCMEQFIWMLLTSKIWEFICFLTIVNVIFVGISLFSQRSTSQRGFDWAITESTSVISEIRADRNPITTSSEVSLNDFRVNINSLKLFLWIPLCFLFCRISGFARFILNMCFLLAPKTKPDGKTVETLYTIFSYLTAFERITSICNIFLVLMFCPESSTWLYGKCARRCRESSKIEITQEIGESQLNRNSHNEDDNTVNALVSEATIHHPRIRTWSGSVIASGSGIASFAPTNSSSRERDRYDNHSFTPSI